MSWTCKWSFWFILLASLASVSGLCKEQPPTHITLPVYISDVRLCVGGGDLRTFLFAIEEDDVLKVAISATDGSMNDVMVELRDTEDIFVIPSFTRYASSSISEGRYSLQFQLVGDKDISFGLAVSLDGDVVYEVGAMEVRSGCGGGTCSYGHTDGNALAILFWIFIAFIALGAMMIILPFAVIVISLLVIVVGIVFVTVLIVVVVPVVMVPSIAVSLIYDELEMWCCVHCCGGTSASEDEETPDIEQSNDAATFASSSCPADMEMEELQTM